MEGREFQLPPSREKEKLPCQPENSIVLGFFFPESFGSFSSSPSSAIFFADSWHDAGLEPLE